MQLQFIPTDTSLAAIAKETALLVRLLGLLCRRLTLLFISFSADLQGPSRNNLLHKCVGPSPYRARVRGESGDPKHRMLQALKAHYHHYRNSYAESKVGQGKAAI